MLENAVVVCVQALVESSKDGKTTTHLLGSPRGLCYLEFMAITNFEEMMI
jgi:hypothetical protein